MQCSLLEGTVAIVYSLCGHGLNSLIFVETEFTGGKVVGKYKYKMQLHFQTILQ